MGPGEITSQTFINLFNSQNFAPAGGATVAALDNDFYPVRNFTGSFVGSAYYGYTTLSTTGPWIFKWDAGRGNFRINFGKAATASNLTGSATLTNNAGSGNLQIENTGGAGSVQITWTNTVAPVITFDGAYTSWNSNSSGNMALYRASDALDYAAGKYWTPEYISLVAGLNPRSIRFMGFNILRQGSQDGNETNWAYRRSPTALTWVTDAFPPGARAGGASTLGTAAWSSSTGIYSAAASDDTTAGAWNMGDCIVATNDTQSNPITISGAAAKTGTNAGKVQLVVNSTTGLVASNSVEIAFVNGTTEANGRQTILSVDDSTHVTINVSFVNAFSSSPLGTIGYQRLAISGKTGSKIILNQYCVPVGIGDRSDQTAILAGAATYIYDSILDAVVYTSGGVSQSWTPIEAQVQLAVACNADMWYNCPSFATDGWVTNSANLMYGLLPSNRRLMYEPGNEPWNTSQTCQKLQQARANKLGLPSYRDYTALRIRQIMGNLLPASNWSAAMNRLDRLYMTQGGSGLNDLGALDYFSGTNLSAYGYDVVGQRPIDFCDSIGYAPYLGGGTALVGQSPDSGGSDPNTCPTSDDAAVLQAIANAWNTGDTATAFSLIDDCIKWGRRGVQTVTWDAANSRFQTTNDHNFQVGEFLRFSVSGGTTYSGVNIAKLYNVISAPTTKTFTVGEVVANNRSSAINAGSAGTGITSVGSLGRNSQQSIFTLVNTFFTKWEAIAAYYDSSLAGIGRPPLKVQWYEGAPQPTGPTVDQCQTLGVAVGATPTGWTTAANLIRDAVDGYKRNILAGDRFQGCCKAFMGTDSASISFGAMPHSIATAQLVLMGGGVYALVADQNVASPDKYKTYDGYAAFSVS